MAIEVLHHTSPVETEIPSAKTLDSTAGMRQLIIIIWEIKVVYYEYVLLGNMKCSLVLDKLYCSL